MVYLTVKEAANLENVTESAIQKRITRQNLLVRDVKSNVGRGGKTYEVALGSLSQAAQDRYWDERKITANETLPAVSDESAGDAERFSDIVSRDLLIERALNAPMGYQKKLWIAECAVKAGITSRTMYRWIDDYEKRQSGIKKVRLTRNDIGASRTWDREAIDVFARILLNHRHMSLTEAYLRAAESAESAGWSIGSSRSAYRVYDGLGAAFHEFRRNGVRGIETNILPPILRDYRDLQVNDIWVGDQHTWNYFVVSEETGRVFRLQGYVWEDMRSRGIAGVSFAEQYDAWAIGLALRDGILKKMDRQIYGKPKCVYTDWGKPERAMYLNKMRACGVDMRDFDNDFEQFLTTLETDEGSGVYEELQISTRKAVVRNSKAKPIERLFGSLERILLDMGLPGYAGNRVGSLTDADKEDLKSLKRRGELLTARQFVVKVLEACEKYNSRSHRGKGMSGMSPNDVFEAAIEGGYRPITLNADQADVLFMKTARRTVSKTGVQIDGLWYHDKNRMLDMVKRRVEVRWDPFRSEKVMIFANGRFECEAQAYRYGSMINAETTAELNEEKKRLKKRVMDEIRSYVAPKEDYDPVPAVARRAVTRFDHAARAKKQKAPVKVKKEIADQDIYRILAETNRSRVFESN